MQHETRRTTKAPSRWRAWAAGLALVLVMNAADQARAAGAEWNPLVERLATDGFDPVETMAIFARPAAAFDASAMGAKMLDLFRAKFGSTLLKKIQTRLDELGYDPGEADGKASSKTRRAIRGFQMVQGLPIDGQSSDKLLTLLLQTKERAPEGFALPEPEPTREGPQVYRSVLSAERMAEAREFYKKHKPLLDEVDKTYGIPPEIAVGLLAVETRVGKFLGDRNALVALASMAASADPAVFSPFLGYEELTPERLEWLTERARQKADWAYAELKGLLTYCRTNRIDPLAVPSSIYGAIGICQFMPTNALKYGVDGNRDGIVDLFNVEDAVHCLANYLVHHGWKGDTSSLAKQRRALYNYNHSTIYVNTILAVADELRGATAAPKKPSTAPDKQKPAGKKKKKTNKKS